MTLAEYIKQLKEQGISREEAIPLIRAFKEKNGLVSGQDTTDENFQQDGVAGAGAPSGIAAPKDTESQPDLGFLDLQDPVEETPTPTQIPLKPKDLVEEEKTLEAKPKPVEAVEDERERFSKEKYFVYTDPQGVEKQMSEEYYLNNLAGKSTTRGKYPVDFDKYRVSLGQRKGYKVSDLKISQPEPLEEVVVIGQASDSVKDSKKIAEKLRNKNLAINEDSEKNNIAVEYFLMDKLDSRDAGTTTYGGQYGTSKFVPTYKSDKEYDAYLKSQLGDEKFNKLLAARSKAANNNVELNKENIGDYISMDSVDEATKTFVINKKKDSENQIFLRNYDEEKQDEIRRFTGDEETVAKKNKLFNEAAKFKIESQEKANQAKKEYFELTGNILVRKTTHLGKVYDPTVRVLDMDKANANILQEREKELLASQKNFKEDVTVFNEKYENLIKAQSEIINYSAEDDVFDTDEEKAKRNSLLSNYETLWNEVTTEQSRLKQLERELFKDVNSFQDTQKIDAAILKNYEYGAKLGHVMEEAFLGSGSMLGSSIFKGIGDISVVTGLVDKESSWYQRMVEQKQHSIDYNRQLQEYRNIYLPDRLTAADSSSKGAYLADMLIENSPSILVAAGTMGYGSIAAGAGVAARIAATRAATNVATAIFFTMEAGGQMSNLEIGQQDAKKLLDINIPGNLISQLEELKQKKIQGEIGDFEIKNIEQQIEDQKNLANLTQVQKSFNSIAYGGIASAAERFGSLSFINNFQKYSRAVGGNTFRKAFGDALGTKISKKVGLATGVGIGASIETVEESLTLYGQNLSDNLIFNPKQPKSLIEGLDGEFFRNVLVTSLGISGPSVASNIYTSIKNEFTTRAQAKKEGAIRQELIEIQEQINNTDLRTKQGRKLQKRKNDLLVEAAELNTSIMLSGRNLSVSDINIIFDNAAEIQRLRNEALDLDPSSFNRKEFKRLKNKAQELMDQNQVILEKNDKAMAALASRASNPVEAETNFRRKQYFKAIAQANKGTNVIDINNVSELESYLEGLGLDDETKRAAILVYTEGGNAMNNNNDILLFNENIDQNILAGGIEAEIASVAALHELGHIQTRKAGIIKGDQLVADSANELVQSIINDVQARAEQGKITEEELDNFNNRISLYANKKYTATEGVDADELIQLVSDFTAIGILPKSSFTGLYGAKTFINSLLKKFNGDAAALFGIKSPKDVYNFVSQFQNKAVKLQLPSGEEEGIKAQKALRQEPSNQLNNIIKNVPKSKTNAEFRANEAVDLYMNVISTEAPVKTRNLLDKVIEKQLIKHDVNTRKDSENANPNVYGVPLAEFIDDVKLHLYDRTINRFDPAVNDNPGAFIITELVNFRVGEISNKYKAQVQTKSIDVQAGETGSIAELVSEDVNIEDQIDAAMQQQTEAPRSALKQELQKDGQPFVDEALEDAIETNTIEIFEGAKPEFTDATLVPFLKQASQQKSFKQIKNKVGDAITFLKDNDNYKTLFHSKNLPVSVLVAMERNVPVADRIFTGEPTRLTTQDQINKAVNDGDFYVENEKTGPSIYPRKKPTVEQLEKFFNVPAVNPITGKRSGLKGTRKDGLVNAVSFGLFRDITPSVMRKLDKPAADIAKTAEKLVVDPTIKFSKTLRTTLDLTSKDINFKNISQIKSARVALGKVSGRLGIENTMKYLLPTVQSGWGLIGGRFVVNNKTVNKFLQVIEEEKGKRTRQFLAVGRGDFFKNVVKNIFPGIKYEKGSAFVTYNNKNIETTKIPTQSPKGFVSGKYNEKMQDRQNFALDQRKGLQLIVNELTYLYQNGDISKNDLAMILATFNSSVNALVRTAALPGLSFKSKDFNNDSDYRYEHTKVARSVLGEISKLIIDKNYNKTFDEILEDYRVAIIPKVYDKIVNKYFSQSQPTDENGEIIPGKGTFVARYEDPRVKKDFKEAGLPDLKLQELKFSKSEPQTSVEIIEDMKQFDTFGMADIVASRLFQNEFKNLPSFKQNYNSLSNEQKAKVQREMLKQNLAPAKFNNKLLPAADQLTGEFTNDQVIAKMQEIDNKNIENEIKFSKSANLNKRFNEIIERSTGISATATISEARAAIRGAKQGRFDIFISPSAEDFVGLLYKTLGKGKQGDADLKFYDDHLLKPFAKANNAITRERLALMDDYKAIKKQIGVVPKDLRKNLEGEDFTREQAVRVYVWTKQGMSVPGLSETDLKKLLTSLKKFPELISFGNQLININKGDGYAAPQNNWLAGSITTDLLQGLNTTKRAKHLQQWQDNVDVIFSKDNLNKLEAAYGKQYVEALKNMLLRMKTGRNRTYGTDSLTGRLTDWINGSVGAIMFFNTRSAVLQLMSATNFVNFSDNNIFAAGKAFANQKQYWTDFIKLFNSDFLLARRDGLKMNVNEADIAEMAKKGGVRGVINELLRFGFTPTQLADSFAIASGGSTFYRNRIKTYLKETDVDGNKIYTQKEAEAKAFEDFRETAEVSQQSSRPDMISQQQAGSLGRLVLAFANTPSQYARIIKKAALDLKNGRGDAKTNISKIVYYTFAQNLLFNALQQGLFALAFGDDEEDEKKKEKTIDVANGMANSLLRGMGFYGAAVAASKDAALRIYKESQKDRPKYEKAAIDFLSISPPISSKYRKIASAGRIIQYENGQIKQKGIAIDNPAVAAGARVVSAATNIPLDRLVTKAENINGALNQDVEYWQRTAMLLGWQDWQIGVETDKDKKEKDKAVGIKRREVERREVKRR